VKFKRTTEPLANASNASASAQERKGTANRAGSRTNEHASTTAPAAQWTAEDAARLKLKRLLKARTKGADQTIGSRFDLPQQTSPQAHLKADTTAASLVAALDRLQPIQRVLSDQLPESLSHQCKAVALTNGELLLVAFSAPAATALIPRLPALKRALQSKLTSVEIAEIRVQVRIDEGVRVAPKPITKGSAPPWQALAAGLEDSPLKTTLEKLAQQQSAHQQAVKKRSSKKS
jgi:hypothetical protein